MTPLSLGAKWSGINDLEHAVTAFALPCSHSDIEGCSVGEGLLKGRGGRTSRVACRQSSKYASLREEEMGSRRRWQMEDHQTQTKADGADRKKGYSGRCYFLSRQPQCYSRDSDKRSILNRRRKDGFENEGAVIQSDSTRTHIRCHLPVYPATDQQRQHVHTAVHEYRGSTHQEPQPIRAAFRKGQSWQRVQRHCAEASSPTPTPTSTPNPPAQRSGMPGR